MGYRFKLILYGLAGLILAFLTYRNLNDAYQAIQDYYNLKKSAADNQYANRNAAQLQSELEGYNHQIGYTTNSDTSNQSRLLAYISEFASQHNTHINLLPKSLSSSENGYEVETNVVQLDGDFKEMLQLLYDIEQKKRLSKVVSVNFELKEDWITKSHRLLATVYFQNIRTQ